MVELPCVFPDYWCCFQRYVKCVEPVIKECWLKEDHSFIFRKLLNLDVKNIPDSISGSLTLN